MAETEMGQQTARPTRTGIARKRDSRPGRGRGRRPPPRRVCTFCVEKTRPINYKDVARLRSFISDRGKIEPRRRTGVCARHQRVLAQALKRARHLALLPFTSAHLRRSVPEAPAS